MFDDLEQIVDKKFWAVVNDLRVHAKKKLRIPYLDDMKIKLKKSDYFPSLPITVQETNKGHGVARQIPIYNLADYSVYYYCVRKLEHVIAKNRVKGTYGGWSMGGKIRQTENQEPPPEEYQLTYSYNPAAWSKYYGDFNARVYGCVNGLVADGQSQYLVYELDIANFYDNIQHPVLENKIRRNADYHESGVLDLLMYFLGYSNRHVTQYQKRTVGIPQDAFGDCSRLLANYYLQDFDYYMSELAKKHKSLYFRYADDQMLFVPDKETGEMLIQLASRRLARIGLNINQKKVIKRTLAELYTHRSFEINDLFAPYGSNKDKVVVGLFAKKTFDAIDKDPKVLKNRGYPLLRRLVTSDFNLLDPSYRTKLMRYIFDHEFILEGRSYTFNAAHSKMRTQEQKDYLKLIDTLITESKHSAFHYEVLAFYRQNKINTKKLEKRIGELRDDMFSVA